MYDLEKKHLILIVDDNPQNLKVLTSILKKENYTIHLAINGESALRSIEAQLPELILLDINMPGLNGFEICNLLKANLKTKDIPIIFLTACISDEDLIKGFQSGAVDYITKPFNSPELKARIKTHLELFEAKKIISQKNKYLDEQVQLRTLELEKSIKQLNKLMDEKNMLIHEINHRVNNNLQFLSSICHLQLEESIPEERSNPLGFFYNRIKSLALIHSELYKSNDYTKVNISNFLVNLFKIILYTFNRQSDQLELVSEQDNFLIDINSAIPLSMILNEILTNSVSRHPSSEIKITFKISMHYDNDKKYKIIFQEKTSKRNHSIYNTKKQQKENEILEILLSQIDGKLQYLKTESSATKIVLEFSKPDISTYNKIQFSE